MTLSVHRLIDPGETFTKINKRPYVFTEGPCYDGKGKIYFVDNEQSWIVTYDIATDTLHRWATDTQGANGTAFLTSGKLVSCRGLGRDVTVWGENGTVEQVLASKFEDKCFNAPNDLIVSKVGWIYFTDPDFEERHGMPEAVYALSPKGDVQRIEQDITRPNGIVLMPDEHTLIVNGTTQRELIAYDVDATGQVSNRRIFATVRDPDRQAYPGYPEKWFGCDGMAVDVEGNLYVTSGAGIQVFNFLGCFVGVLKVPQKPTNVCFGGEENRTMFVTAQSSIYRVRSKIPGIVFQQST